MGGRTLGIEDFIVSESGVYSAISKIARLSGRTAVELGVAEIEDTSVGRH
jgi:hypothetical protein